MTRQAARKVADGLEQRGYATTERDSRDTRQLNVTLTQLGREYARAITAVIEELNREVAGRVSPDQLAAADTVLRAALFDDSARQRASRLLHLRGNLPRPSGNRPGHQALPGARTQARAAGEVDQVPLQFRAALDEDSEALPAVAAVHVGSRPSAASRRLTSFWPNGSGSSGSSSDQYSTGESPRNATQTG